MAKSLQLEKVLRKIEQDIKWSRTDRLDDPLAEIRLMARDFLTAVFEWCPDCESRDDAVRFLFRACKKAKDAVELDEELREEEEEKDEDGFD